MYKSGGRTRVFTRIQNLQTSILEIGKYFHQEQSPNIRPLFCWLFVLIKPSIKYGHWARSTLRTKFDLKDPTSLQLLYNEQFVLAVLAVWNVESFLSILLIYKIQQIINNLTRLQSTNRSYYFAHALWSLLNKEQRPVSLPVLQLVLELPGLNFQSLIFFRKGLELMVCTV